jgi:hypothetical protein
MARPEVQKKLVNQVFAQIQQQYAEEQRTEAAELHNRFAQIIDDIKPSAESLLLILELLKQEALGNLIDKFEQIKAMPSGEEVGATPSKV